MLCLCNSYIILFYKKYLKKKYLYMSKLFLASIIALPGKNPRIAVYGSYENNQQC